MKTRIYLACVFLYFFCSVMLHAQTRRYVATPEWGGMLGGSGYSWSEASADLQEIIEISSPGDEIWVAQGVYTPFYGAEMSVDDDPRKSAFILKDGVKIYGGFNPDNDRREGASVLDGFRQDADCHVYHVVIAVNCNEGTVLDGFTITGGNANGTDSMLVNDVIVLNNCGGGIYNENSYDVQFANLRVVWNEAFINGGGIYESDGSSSCISNCYIQANTAGFGAGVYCLYNYPNNTPARTKIASTLISGNKAIYKGGALYNAASEPVLVNVTISGNHAQGNVDLFCGIYNANDPCTDLSAYTSIYNSILSGNGIANFSICNESGTSCDYYDSFIDNIYAGYLAFGAPAAPDDVPLPDFYSPVNSTTAPTVGGDYRINNIEDYWGPNIDWIYYCSPTYSIHPDLQDYLDACGLEHFNYFDLNGYPLEGCGIGAFVCRPSWFY